MHTQSSANNTGQDDISGAPFLYSQIKNKQTNNQTTKQPNQLTNKQPNQWTNQWINKPASKGDRLNKSGLDSTS
jgi:hypothetical protein